MQVAGPEFAHRYVQLFLVQQGVFGNLKRYACCFPVGSDSLFAQKIRRDFVMVFGKHVGQCATKVPQETIAHFRVSNDATREYWQIRCRVVMTPKPKLADHLLGPVLHTRFPTIQEHVPKTLPVQWSKGPGDRVDIPAQITFCVFGTQFIDFVTQSSRYCGTILRARK